MVVAVTVTPPPLQLATFKVPTGVAIALPANPQTAIPATIQNLFSIFFFIILRTPFVISFVFDPSTLVDYHYGSGDTRIVLAVFYVFSTR